MNKQLKTKGHQFFLFLALLLSLLACKNNTQENSAESNTVNGETLGTILDKLTEQYYNPDNTYAAGARLAHYDSLLKVTQDIQSSLNYAVLHANTLLEYGKEKRAVAELEKIYDYVKSVPASRLAAGEMLGVAYMRLAERTNCIARHNADACILPIKGLGIHQDKGPARKAVEIFEKILKEDPKMLNSRWLLNIAYMTLGEYPNGVPKEFLIPGIGQGETTTVKPFTEMASDLGIALYKQSGGTIVDDFDNDGNLDIVVTGWSLKETLHYYHNNGDGSFSDFSERSGLNKIRGGLNMMQTDYNNDGKIDIFLLRGAWQGSGPFAKVPNSLLKNNGDGTFTDVTIQAGILSFNPTQAATWNDFNNDGWLDVFIGNESLPSNNIYPSEFYINNQDGTFTNIASPQGLNIKTFVKACTSGDYDNDGWADIFISCLTGEKILLRNKGVKGKVPTFENTSQQAGLAQNKERTFPTFFFDYDIDGWLDLFICNYSFEQQLSFFLAKETLYPSNDQEGKIILYHNNQNGTFSEVSGQMHLNQPVFAMAANFGDFDNDGWLDMFMSTGNPNYRSLIPNRLYKNMGGTDFMEVTYSARVGNLQKGHGVAFADINNNGDQDIYVNIGGAYEGDAFNSAFYLNPGQNDNNWITMQLEGVKSNKAAIGARIRLKFTDNGKQRFVYRDLNSGGSFGSSPLRREIGLGQAKMIDEIQIKWPASGTVQTITNIKPNQFIKITEGKEGYSTINLKNIVFKYKSGGIPMCAPRVSI